MSSVDYSANSTDRFFDQGINALILKLYDAATDRDKWSGFLSTLATYFDAPCAHLGNIDPSNTSLTFSVVYGYDEHFARLYGREHDTSLAPALDRWSADFSRLMPSDPRITVMQKFPNRPFSCRLAISEDDWHNSAMYKELSGPTNIEYSLLVTVLGDNGLLTGLGVFRGKESRPFDASAVDKFGLLVPHLRRAVAIQAMFSAKEAERLMGLEALDGVPMSTFIVEANCTVRHMNTAATELIDCHDVIAISNGRLIFEGTGYAGDIPGSIAELAHTNPNRAPPESAVYSLRNSNDGRPLSVLITPLWRNKLRHHPDSTPAPLAIVYISDPDRPCETPVELIQRLYGLTQAEARLAEAISRGSTLREVAVEFDLSESTVRNQLKSVFSKTGTNRQSDLVRLLMSSPLRFLRSSDDRD